MSGNPYRDFGSKLGPARLVGRHEQLRRIAERCFYWESAGLCLHGLPRIGKSSLVGVALRRLEDIAAGEGGAPSGKAFAAVVDCGVDHPRDLFATLVREVKRGLDRSQGWTRAVRESLEQAQAATAGAFDWAEVRSALTDLFECLRDDGVKAVVVFEEFDRARVLFKEEPRCFSFFRNLGSDPWKAGFITVSRRSPMDIGRAAGVGSYWDNAFMDMSLGPLAASEVDELLERLRDNGALVDEAVLDDVRGRYRGHPLLLDAFCYHAWEWTRRNSRSLDEEGYVAVRRDVASSEFKAARDTCDLLAEQNLETKAVQLFCGPQYDIRRADEQRLMRMGVARLDRATGKMLPPFEGFVEYLEAREAAREVWPLWRRVEQGLRRWMVDGLVDAHGEDWLGALRARSPKRSFLERWRVSHDRRGDVAGAGLTGTPLDFSYPDELFQLVQADWERFGSPLLGARDFRIGALRMKWTEGFRVLASVRAPIAHNRATEQHRRQAADICAVLCERLDALGISKA